MAETNEVAEESTILRLYRNLDVNGHETNVIKRRSHIGATISISMFVLMIVAINSSIELIDRKFSSQTIHQKGRSTIEAELLREQIFFKNKILPY